MQTLEQAETNVNKIIHDYRNHHTCTSLYYEETYQTIRNLSPLEASVFLSSHHIVNNRKERKGATQSLTFEISNDRWIPIASTIKISTEGKLIDGQHRLSAIAQQEKTVQVIFQHNVPRRVLHFLDNNVKRNAADIFMLSGQFKKTTVAKHAQQLTALLVFLQEQGHHIATTGDSGRAVTTAHHTGHSLSTKAKVAGASVSEYLKYYAEHKEEVDKTVSWVSSNIKNKHTLINIARIMCLYHLCRFINEVAAQEYVKNIFNQTGLIEGSTESKVYEILLDAKSDVKSKQLSGKEREETMYHGFYLSYIKNQKRRQIKIKFVETPEIKEAFRTNNHQDIEFLPSREIYSLFKEKYDEHLLQGSI